MARLFERVMNKRRLQLDAAVTGHPHDQRSVPVDVAHDRVALGVQVDAYRNAGGRRVLAVTVDGMTLLRAEVPEDAVLRLGSGHELIGNLFERDGLG